MKKQLLAIKACIIDALPDWFILIFRWSRCHRTFPNVSKPVTFNEKILYRILFDRRPIFTTLADKAAVRTYVEECVGPAILPKLYHLTSQPEDIPFGELPDRFVVKPTHGSGWVKLVPDKSTLDRAALVRACTGWLNQDFYKETRERHYKGIERRILIEEFIDDGSGAAPNDYKLFVFGGKVELIQVDTGRFVDHRRRLYRPNWQEFDARLEYENIAGDVPPPPHLAEMIAAAEKLGRGLDFIRADFYDTPQGIYFGELTATPACGLGLFYPKEFDHYLGGRWNLVPGRRLSIP